MPRCSCACPPLLFLAVPPARHRLCPPDRRHRERRRGASRGYVGQAARARPSRQGAATRGGRPRARSAGRWPRPAARTGRGRARRRPRSCRGAAAWSGRTPSVVDWWSDHLTPHPAAANEPTDHTTECRHRRAERPASPCGAAGGEVSERSGGAGSSELANGERRGGVPSLLRTDGGGRRRSGRRERQCFPLGFGLAAFAGAATARHATTRRIRAGRSSFALISPRHRAGHTPRDEG